jgi:ketosteroid isomerase-like protein
MRDRNVDIARRGIEAFNRGDADGMLAIAAPDIEVYAPPDSPNPGHYRGHDGFMQWMGAWMEAWETFTLDVLDIEAIDDRHVVGAVRQNGRGRLSGLEITMEVAHLYEIDDEGRVVRFELHLDRASALARVDAAA